MPSSGDSAFLALLVKIRQLEDEAGRLRLLIAELLVKISSFGKQAWSRKRDRKTGAWGEIR